MFEGFNQPKQNWSKLPHQFIEAMDKIETIGEMKVILYILRHTWGYHETEKRITLDEFAHGRKRRDGSRLDSGTGLSIPTIRNGLKRAEEHGFIQVETDNHDLARVKKVYSLKPNQTERNLQSGCKNLSPGVQETYNRTEKDTIERNSSNMSDSKKRESPHAGEEPEQPCLIDEMDMRFTNEYDRILKQKIAESTSARLGRNARGPRKFKTVQQRDKWRAATEEVERVHNGHGGDVIGEFVDTAMGAGRTDVAGVINYVAAMVKNGAHRKVDKRSGAVVGLDSGGGRVVGL